MKFYKIIAIAVLLTALISCSSSKTEVDISLIPVESGEKWGYINQKGEYIINPQFNDAGFFRDGLARVVAPDGKIGYIDTKGNYIIMPKYKDGTHFYEGVAFVVEQGGKPTCIDKKGEPKFVLDNAEVAITYSCGLAAFINGNMVGWIDKSGDIVINPQQYDIKNHITFCEDLNPVQLEDGNEWGVIDKTGKFVINPQFKRMGNFKEGKAWFYNGEQYGYVNTKGEYVINPQFEFCADFSEGLARFRQGKYGFIDENGKIAINPQFDANGGDFKNGYAKIKQGEKYGYIDKEGKIVINPQFDNASDFFGDIAFVKSANKWGIIDREGKYIVTPQFDYIKNEIEEYGVVESDYYDLSAFENKFFGDNAPWNYNNFLGITLQELIDNETYGSEIKNIGEKKSVAWKGEYDIADFKLKEIRFNSDDAFYSYNYFSGYTYNFDTKVKSVMYDLSFTNIKQSEKFDVIYNILTDYITNKYNLSDTQHGKYWTYSGTASDGKDVWISVDENEGITVFFGLPFDEEL